MAATSSSSPPPNEETPTNQEPIQQDLVKESIEEIMYKTKSIQFLGRTTPIILQNENGPCALLAICNVLLLRNNLNLNPDCYEVSQERLLSLVVVRLIDSNSKVNNKDEGYIENQQQNIADALDLLPRLTTGIDVNIKFRRIDDFEFTPACAIFDLLDIPLYHGWIVDPQDVEAANAIGSKSYNALMAELVALETQNVETQGNQIPGEDSVDFAAATTDMDHDQLSSKESGDVTGCDVENVDSIKQFVADVTSSEAPLAEKTILESGKVDSSSESVLKSHTTSVNPDFDSRPEADDVPNALTSTVPTDEPMYEGFSDGLRSVFEKDCVSSKPHLAVSNEYLQEPASVSSDTTSVNPDFDSRPEADDVANALTSTVPTDEPMYEGEECVNAVAPPVCPDKEPVYEVEPQARPRKRKHFDRATVLTNAIMKQRLNDRSDTLRKRKKMPLSKVGVWRLNNNKNDRIFNDPLLTARARKRKHFDRATVLTNAIMKQRLDDPSDTLRKRKKMHLSKVGVWRLNNNKNDRIFNDPLLTGFSDGLRSVFEKDCVSSKPHLAVSDETLQEPASVSSDTTSVNPGELIRNFMKNSASQLTFCGLLRLQEGLKERELCVFFSNNHFCTMFKYEGELYLLATDQGYLNQPDLVWEKLNEVNGDTAFMTSTFKDFKIDSTQVA